MISIRSLALAASLILSGSAAMASTVLVSDSFALNGTTRTAGSELAGLAPEVGSGLWTSSFFAGNSVFGADGDIVRKANSTTEARIGLSVPQHGILTLESELTGINGGWSSVGFTTSATTSQAGAWAAANFGTVLWARIQGGSYFINVNGVGFQIGNGSISGFGYAKDYTMVLSYDLDNIQVSLSISNGGTEVVNTGWINVAAVSQGAADYLSGATIGAAGFRIEGAAIAGYEAYPKVESFSVVTTVPEGSTVSLVLAGAALLGLAGFKARRGNAARR